MRYYRQKLKVRPRSRLDPTRPIREAVRVVERDLKRLASAVTAARTRLEMTQDEFAKACGLGIVTIQRVEKGIVTPRAKTFAGLDRGAQWPDGTARAIYETGAEPPEPTTLAAGPVHEWSAAERARMRDMPWTEVRETYETFARKSEFVANVWMREVMRVKAEAEVGERLTTKSEPLS
jgi:transcriptional regulator with XRE-family HTH domain